MTAPGNFIFICPACGYKARLPDQFAGRTIKCPGCQAPQVATAPLNTEHKTASFIRVAATPVPFTMPQEQIDALAGATSATSATPSALPNALPLVTPTSFPSPLPGAIQITTDRITNRSSTVPGAVAPVAKAVVGGTVDFTCNSCHARLRLPAHYTGKSILCPKCSAPQKVLAVPLTAPMDTTRSIANKEDSALVVAIPPGTGTGLRVRVTPLPSTYPTPLPTAMTVPTAEFQSALKPNLPVAAAAPIADPVPPIAAPEAPAPVATPVATPADNEALTIPSANDDGPVKPHPSRGKLKTEAVKRPVAVTGAPEPISSSTTAPKTPTFLIATAGVAVVLAIALGAGLAYFALALGQTKTRLDEAQLVAKEASEREHAASKKANELNARVAELEAALQVLEKAAVTNANESTAPKPDAEPRTPDAAPATAPEPAPEPAAAPEPAPEPAPAPEPVAEPAPK